MRPDFYTKLAMDGIRKNRRIYVPYLFMGAALVAMHYILAFLQYTDTISHILGVRTVRLTLRLGGWVLAVFSCGFLLYADSFLLGSRKKEFGLYHIFGMDKKGLRKLLQRETVILAAISMGTGLMLGIACSKFAELGLIRIVGAESTYTLAVASRAVALTFGTFTVVFALQLLFGLRQLKVSTAIALLHSESAAEQPPRANTLLGILGAALLAAAYWIAATADFPSARALVAAGFLAVLLVICGTFLTMTAGCVTLCRTLQKNKRYYYRSSHFVSVSAMAFRMKRNGVGLASVCILITMVLVTVSSTACLLYGAREDFLRDYPREITLDFVASSPEQLESSLVSLQSAVSAGLSQRNIAPERGYAYRLLEVVSPEQDWALYFLPLEDYNQAMGTDLTLPPGKALVFPFGNDFPDAFVSLPGITWEVAGKLDRFPYAGREAIAVNEVTVAVILPDFDGTARHLTHLSDTGEGLYAVCHWVYNFDTGLEPEGQLALYDDIHVSFDGLCQDHGFLGLNCGSREEQGGGEFDMYGGIFFLGILLSAVFVCAAMLIIYYKQITQSLEDRSRFQTMRRLGMTRKEIRNSIRWQMLAVFFLPILLAIVHLAFAFPMLQRLLLVFKLSNTPLFLRVTAIAVALIGALYAAVYHAASKVCCQLAIGEKKEEMI